MISIIIPAFNAGEHIYEAVWSALIQDVKKEIIIIDDCSNSDWVEELILRFETDLVAVDSNRLIEKVNKRKMSLIWSGVISAGDNQTEGTNVYILRNNKNVGVALTRNRGVRLARGRYVAFLDADDVWAEGKLVAQKKLLDKYKDVPLCNTARVLIDEAGLEIGSPARIIGTPSKITLADLQKSNVINCSSVLVRKKAMLSHPMKYSNAHEDYYSWLKLLEDYEYVIGINEPLLRYRVSKQSKSGSKIKSAWMTYKTYRYAGYGIGQSLKFFVKYAINGIKKYV